MVTTGWYFKDHILQCPHDTRQVACTKLINDIGQYMRKTGTPMEIKNWIIQGITAWLTGNEPPVLERIVTNHSLKLQKAYTTQNTIGWRHFLKGILSIHWTTLVNRESQGNIDGQEISTISQNHNQKSWGSRPIYILWKHVLVFGNAKWCRRRSIQTTRYLQGTLHDYKNSNERTSRRCKHQYLVLVLVLVIQLDKVVLVLMSNL